jgi:acyl-CoA thioester hydrolase
LYVVEAHILYLRELKNGERFFVETILAEADDKRLHLYQSLLNCRGDACATSEVLCLHVNLDGDTPRAKAFNEDHLESIRNLVSSHYAIPRQLSRSIAIRKKR